MTKRKFENQEDAFDANVFFAEEPQIEEVIAEESAPVEEVQVPLPVAEFVLDGSNGNLWLRSATARVINVFRSVRFDPDGVEVGQWDFIISLLIRSLKTKYKGYKDDEVAEQLYPGVLYIPVYLSKSPSLIVMERGKTIGEYVEFFKK